MLKGNEFLIFDQDIDIYSDVGKLLCKFRKNILTSEECKILFGFKNVAKMGPTRPSASGFKDKEHKYKTIIAKKSKKPLRVLTTKACSGILGFYDSVSNFGPKHAKNGEKCRLTAFTSSHFEQYEQSIPIFNKIDNLFKNLVPILYANQLNAINKLDPKYRIGNTVFTTVTINRNFRTAVHKDQGDYKEGFGIMVVVSNNDNYSGCNLLLPEFKLGINCRNGDFLAFDVHRWHCNSKLTHHNAMNNEVKAERVSFVFYLREKMLNLCPSISL